MLPWRVCSLPVRQTYQTVENQHAGEQRRSFDGIRDLEPSVKGAEAASRPQGRESDLDLCSSTAACGESRSDGDTVTEKNTRMFD